MNATAKLHRLIKHRSWLAWLHGSLALIAAFAFWATPTSSLFVPRGRGAGMALVIYTFGAWFPLWISWLASRRTVAGSTRAFVAFVVVLVLIQAVVITALIATDIPGLLLAAVQTVFLVGAALFCSILSDADIAVGAP